ncbi:helix-turn-helix domain-containing protein [Halobaculum halobium]|uniref:Winged helix-turn-helix domain-containing protein n=1 Tax=Halobaculum halobium TaxID=3032281 RepID=A0ABD5T9X4_9EURY
MHEPPDEVGIDATAWTPALAQKFLEETHGVKYSVSSCRRLLKEAKLSHENPAKADEDEQERFHDELKKRNGRWTPP